jgi:hypothetical protein
MHGGNIEVNGYNFRQLNFFRCECPPGRQLTADHSCIVKVARAGDACQNGELCMGSFCKNGTCSCLERGFVLRHRKCVKVSQLKPMDVQPKPKSTEKLAQTTKPKMEAPTTQKPIIQPLSEAINTKVVLMSRSLNETKKTKELGLSSLCKNFTVQFF